MQYLDELPVERGVSPVTLRIRRDANQIMFTSTPPQTRPRHSNIPQWHYDMLNDVGRNDAYEAAIKAAVTRHVFICSLTVCPCELCVFSGVKRLVAFARFWTPGAVRASSR